MKNTRALIVLAVAVVAGLIAVLLAFRWLSSQTNNNVAQVAVAATEISLGQRISSDMVKLVDWPAASVPEGSVNVANKLEGRVARTALQRGEPILEAKLAPKGTQGGLSAVIGEGRRAITVRVNDVIGVAGFALPGNFVDIIVNTHRDTEDSGARDQTISKIVLERILVLAVAQEVSRDETKPRVVNAVTLEVTPEQAEKIDLARSVGTLSLVLRNQIDPGDATTAGVTKSTLLQLESAAASAAKPIAEPAVPPAAPAPAPAVRKTVHRRAPASTAPNGAPNAAMSAAQPADAPTCVGVINGLRGSQECY